MPARIIYKVGDKLHANSLLTYQYDTNNRPRKAMFLCECGNEKSISINDVKSGCTLSCGCYHASIMAGMSTHGMAHTKIHNTWKRIVQKCTNSKNPDYKYYGGRGILMCDKWRNSFEAFYADMGDVNDGMTIDRIDNNGNYEPSNCRWATRLEQARNTRQNCNLIFNGKTRCIAAWAEEIGINRVTLSDRINKLGWTTEQALTTPVRGAN